MNELQNNNAKNVFENIGRAMITFAEKLNQFRDWWQEHEAIILNYLEKFSYPLVYYRAIERLIQGNVICTYDLNMAFAAEIVKADNVESALRSYYFSKRNTNMKVLLSRCQSNLAKLQRDSLFAECVSSYRRREYHLAIIGVFALADGVLADITSNPKETSFRIRLHEIHRKICDNVPLSEYDLRLLPLSAALKNYGCSPFDKSDFGGAEPPYPHRHWLLHGRSHHSYSKYDFLSALLWLDAMLFLAETLNSTTE